MKLELAKAGNHNGITITIDDIADMAETFSGDIPPVTIGHELDDTMPAYGWVKSLNLSEDGATLIGEIELGEELEKAISDGRYKNWSIGAGRDTDDRMYLHHVAFLGAVPPMIKDLQIIHMGDKSDIITYAIPPSGTCSFLLSDTDLVEYTSLRIEKKNLAVKKNFPTLHRVSSRSARGKSFWSLQTDSWQTKMGGRRLSSFSRSCSHQSKHPSEKDYQKD